MKWQSVGVVLLAVRTTLLRHLAQFALFAQQFISANEIEMTHNFEALLFEGKANGSESALVMSTENEDQPTRC
jgi:hypothetical protein